MYQYPRFNLFVLALFLMMTLTGCPGPATEETGEEADSETKEVLLEPFDAPKLADLDAQVEWEDQPVLDSLELLRERQSQEKPQVTVEEALKLKNTDQEMNEKILSALGRLPENDEQVDWGATINRHVGADLKSTNPIMGSSAVEFEVSSLTGFGLFSFDWNFKPFAVSDTVVSWQSSKDKLYDKVVLRDDLTWSDGTPITAHDIVFTFKTIMNPAVPVPAVRSGTDQIRWIQAYDDQTLVFFHKESLPTNVWNLNFPIIPKHIYEKELESDPTLQDSPYHVKFENDPVTGGPYQFEKRERGQEILLKRRESWYMQDGKQVRTRPYFERVRLRIIEDPNTALLALKNGKIDEMALNPELWKTQTEDDDFYKICTKANGLEWVYFYFGWNCETLFFQDKEVRQAMSYAFNHKEMLDELCYGLYQPCTGIFHETAWMSPDPMSKPYQQNLAKAEKLLDEAGWIDHDGDGIRDKEFDGKVIPFRFSIMTSSQPLSLSICTLLKENLAQIGIICEVKPTEFTVMQDKARNHQFQAMFGGWGTGTDPDTSINLWKTEAARNYVNYSNPEVDKLFEEGRREFDKEKRAKIYGKIHELLYDDQPYTWLYFRNSFYGFNKDLRGYVFSPRGPYGYGPGFSSLWKPVEN
ncbi:peptide-binding protein [Gimesia sp.]|uniref:peptide-binding protein n=1 Tax=Gimesia sp. TaxID=2024833 RepID=UPI000C3E96F7|nr:peptide-binding protein [Gimesia sp.]MAX36564.1 peptide ABC transporter substrate-binding protein [Gimesia sp.]HAH49038.1 peptide ABC transporter substrate-binding protein [Planctomycetaceae bacterium]|tara:strand:+ start:98129 stop:100048 length:1920 start_codon:yes stop_codon:yes gene_type:complete